jgi:hypothetical protein
VEEYRTSMTHMSHQYDGPTMESSTVIPRSQDDKAHVPNSYLKSLLNPFYGASRPLSDGSPNSEGGTSTIATNAPPALPIEGYEAYYGVDSSSFGSFEAARRPRIGEQPTISTYGAQTQLLQMAGQSTIADSITRAGTITAGTIGTVGSIGVSSSYYISQQANAQNEAKFSWEREQARGRERLDERESALERREQALRERESTFEERERNLQVELGELEHEVHIRKEGIRRREDELEKTNKKYGDWGKELNKVQAEVMRRENELKERSEELRMTAMKLREREDELSRTGKKHFERGKELNKIQAEITWSEHELEQKGEELREREDEWKRQQQQCHCRHRALEPNSNISSRTSSTNGNEPPKPESSTTPLETDECSTLPPTKQSSNQIQPSLSLPNEDCNPNQQTVSFPTSTASQPSTAEPKTSSQPITMNIQDTAPTISNTPLVTSKLVSSELKSQLLTDTDLDLPVRSPNKDVKNTNYLALTSTQMPVEKEGGKERCGKVREEVNEIASENEPKHDD